jgi:hypothetical protein
VQVFEFVNVEIFQIFKFHNERKSLPPSTLDVQKPPEKELRTSDSGYSEVLLQLVMSANQQQTMDFDLTTEIEA